jgi:hypothetical protein
MQLLRLNSIALAVVMTQAAVLPRQEGSSSPLASLPNTSATSKAYLTSITTLPMPSSVEGNTAYPPSTTSAGIPAPAQTSALSTPYTSALSAPTSQSPLSWNANATSSSNMTVSPANATTSMGSSFATGLSASTGNVTVAGVNSTLSSVSAASTGFASSTQDSTALASATNAVMNGTDPASATSSSSPAATTAENSDLRSSAPYANSTTSGLIGGVAATGTAVIVTGVSAINATQSATGLPGNSTVPLPALIGSTSSIMQLYLSLPTSLRAARATRTPSPSSIRAPVALFGANTTAPGVAAATGINVPSTTQLSNTTMATVVSKTTAAASNATSTSPIPLSTKSSSSSTNEAPSPLVANAVDNNGTMYAISQDGKNGTIIQLIPATNSTNALAATGTTTPLSTASASADLGRREAPVDTSAPIEPAAAPKGFAWNKLTYASTESVPRPSRFFSGEGWMLRRRFWA